MYVYKSVFLVYFSASFSHHLYNWKDVLLLCLYGCEVKIKDLIDFTVIAHKIQKFVKKEGNLLSACVVPHTPTSLPSHISLPSLLLSVRTGPMAMESFTPLSLLSPPLAHPSLLHPLPFCSFSHPPILFLWPPPPFSPSFCVGSVSVWDLGSRQQIRANRVHLALQSLD